MNAITIVLRSGMGMQLAAIRPYLRTGMPIAIGRAGAVIAEVADGNAIEDKRKAAESAGGYIDSVERYMESAGNLESVVAGLEGALIGIDACAADGQSEPWAALRRIREITAAFLDNSGARAEPVQPGAAAALRLVDPGERHHSHQRTSGELCPLCGANNHSEDSCHWKDAREALAFAQKLDKHLVDHAAEFNTAPGAALKPSIFEVITGTANLPPQAAQELPSREEHAAQIERVAADLREHGPDRVTLKPCAFCGGPPAPFVQIASQGFGSAPRLDSYGDDGLSVEAFVFCHECGAHGPTFEEDIFDASDYDQAMAEGVASGRTATGAIPTCTKPTRPKA